MYEKWKSNNKNIWISRPDIVVYQQVAGEIWNASIWSLEPSSRYSEACDRLGRVKMTRPSDGAKVSNGVLLENRAV
jgi:hypothetical protein